MAAALILVFSATLLYIQSLWGINSQYTEIWYDTMEQNDGWSSSGLVEFAYDSTTSCTSSPCTKGNYVDYNAAWIRRPTDISQYSSLLFGYDVVARALEEGDQCRVYYSYIGSSLSDRELIHSITPPVTSEDRISYPNQQIMFPDASYASTVWIWMEVWSDGSGNDWCYWDDVYLYGIKVTGPTIKPTSVPTPVPTLITKNKPTPNPTPLPTLKPTLRPTNPPTHRPTKTPIEQPTKNPSASPSEKPSSATTLAPTHNPIPAPTSFPTTPGTMACGNAITGNYNGELVTFIINIPYDETDVVFDTTASEITVNSIEATSILGTVLLGSTTDPFISLSDVKAGNYKIMMSSDQTGTYNVQLRCITQSPTTAPTIDPTLSPTSTPTRRPSKVSLTSTLTPALSPSSNDEDTSKVITIYIVAVQVCNECEFDEDEISNTVNDIFLDYYVSTATNIQTDDDTITMEVSVKTDSDTIFNEKEMEDVIEKRFEEIYPETDVYVEVTQKSQIDTNQTDDDHRNDINWLWQHRMLWLLFIAVFAICLGCCCGSCICRYKQKQKIQQQMIQQQSLEIQKFKESIEINKKMEENGLMPSEGPQFGMQRIVNVDQIETPALPAKMTQITMMMHFSSMSSTQGETGESDGRTFTAIMDKPLPQDEERHGQDEEAWEYYYEEETEEDVDSDDMYAKGKVTASEGQ